MGPTGWGREATKSSTAWEAGRNGKGHLGRSIDCLDGEDGDGVVCLRREWMMTVHDGMSAASRTRAGM